jgi:hypothetical protein
MCVRGITGNWARVRAGRSKDATSPAADHGFLAAGQTVLLMSLYYANINKLLVERSEAFKARLVAVGIGY